MLLSEALEKISYALRGLDDSAPSVGTEEGNYWVSLLNDKKNELYQDVKQNWSSIFGVESIGTISASSSLVFDLPDSFLGVAGTDFDDVNGSDAYIIMTDGTRRDVKIVKPSQRGHAQQLYISGMNPQTITFTKEILATDDIVGGELFLPAYYLPDDITLATDVLPVPNPNWLVQAVAADIAYSDIIYEDKAEGLNAKANNLYRMMTSNNRRGSNGAVRTMQYAVNRIRGTR